MALTNLNSSGINLPTTNSKNIEETQKQLSDKTLHTDQSKSPIFETSMSTTLRLENDKDVFEKLARSTSLDPKLGYSPHESSEEFCLFRSKSNNCEQSAELMNPINSLSKSFIPIKSIIPNANTETIVAPLLNSISAVSSDTHNMNSKDKNKDSINSSSFDANEINLNIGKLSEEESKNTTLPRDSILKNSYIDKPLMPNTEMILSNCSAPMLTAPIVIHDEDKLSSDSENSTIFITRTSTALKRENKKNLASDITRLKLYLPKKFVMQLEQNWFFSIRKYHKVTIELSSYKYDTKSIAVTIVGLVKNISEACGKIAEAKLRILYKNSNNFNNHSCRMYMVESKKTCKSLKKKHKQFLEFISKKYKCGITIGSDENPRGDEDIIGLSGNSIGIKQVVYEILKKIEFGTLKANDDSIIEAEGKLKTYKRKTKKSKRKSNSKNTENTEINTIDITNSGNDSKDDSMVVNSLPFKTLDITQDKFIGNSNSSLFSESLLFLNEPAVRKELLGYSHINVIFYKIGDNNVSIEILAGFDSIYKPFFGKNTLKNYKNQFDVYIDLCSFSNNKQQKFTMIASIPNALKVLDKINNRLNTHLKIPSGNDKDDYV